MATRMRKDSFWVGSVYELDGMTLDDLRKEIDAWENVIVNSRKGDPKTIKIDIITEEDYDGGTYRKILLDFRRPETPAEERKRLKEAERRKKAAAIKKETTERKEKKLYEKLHKKYGGK